MTTATKPRAKAKLPELERLEPEWGAREAEADALGKEHGAKAQAALALQDERRRLIHREKTQAESRRARA